MKALTICQPYAELILRQEKLVENRRWSMAYRGPLAIHAGKSRAWLDSFCPLPEGLIFGAVVGICDLVAILPAVTIARGRLPEAYRHLRGHVHVEGPQCWVLENVQRLAVPVLYRGEQNLFDIPDALLQNEIAQRARESRHTTT